MDTAPEIPLKRMSEFVRQHTHDVRNGLNSLDLEATYLAELVTDSEAVASVERIQRQLRTLAQQLRGLSMKFQSPQPLAAPMAARVLLQIWREKHQALPKAPEVRWEDELGSEEVNVDVGMMAAVFQELLTNAAAFSTHAPMTVTARVADREIILELREPKTEALDTSAWGQPFYTTRRGAYGLGLWSAHRMLQANGATLVQRYAPEDGCLISRIVLAVF